MNASIVQPARPSAFAVFRNRNFTRLWTGQLISTIGSALTDLAAGILVYRLTGSALNVGLMMLVTALPGLLVGLFAGVFVDRGDRKKIMIAADLIRMLLVGAIPFLLPFGIATLYIVVLLSSTVHQFFDPAHESVLPEVASDEELAAANSMIAISSFGSTAIGYAAAGLIASRFPIEWAFYLDGLSFLLSALCIAFVRIAPHTPEEATSVAVVLSDLREGVKFLFGSTVLRSLLLLCVPIFISFGLINSLLLPFAIKALHASEFEYGLQEGLTSVGFVIGSLLMARLADRLREAQWIALSFTGMALGGIVYAFTTSVPFAIALMFVSGFLNALNAIGRRLAIQRNTTPEVRGRVASAFFVTRDAVFLIGMLAAGLADLYDIRLLFVLASVVLLGAGALALFLPGLRQSVAEWRQASRLLRNAHAAPSLGLGRAARPSDLDWLITHLHALAGLSPDDRKALIASSRAYEVPSGTAIVRQGEASDAIFFVLGGRAVAGAEGPTGYHSLNTLEPGEFFGEIAALTGTPRTATVVAEEPTTVLGMPATTLRRIMRNPLVNGVFLELMGQRLARLGSLMAPFAAGEQPGPRAANTAVYTTLLLHKQLDPYVTTLLRDPESAYATMIIQGQVA
jgi:CRP-like cAMP-binding protein/predicted MFS family arabinose efflux permease